MPLLDDLTAYADYVAADDLLLVQDASDTTDGATGTSKQLEAQYLQLIRGTGRVYVDANGVVQLAPASGQNVVVGSGSLIVPNGSETTPSIARSDNQAGIVFVSNSTIDFKTAAAIRMRLSGGALTAAEGFRIGASAAAPDIFLLRDAAGVLAQRNGANAQTFRLYGLYTDASNYERVILKAVASSDFQLVPEAAGTGTLRGLSIGAASGKLGFFGGTAIAKPSVTGSRGGNAALADLLTQLAALGLIADSSVA